jgi:hypothetical protein
MPNRRMARNRFARRKARPCGIIRLTA